MKKNNLLFILIVCIVCSTNAQSSAQTTSELNALKWTGSTFFKYNKQFGTITFLNGDIIDSNDVHIGGNYEINLESLINSKNKINKVLAIHLESENVFKSESGITPKLKLTEMITTSVNTISVKGLLIINGVANKIDFVLHEEHQDGKQFFLSTFSINESKNSSEPIEKGCMTKLIHFKVKIEGMAGDKC